MVHRYSVVLIQVRPICLPVDSNSKYENSKALVAGWGKTGNGNGVSSYLQVCCSIFNWGYAPDVFFSKEIDLLVWPQKRCRKAFGSSIADNMMCVSKKKKPIDATCNVGELCSHTFLNLFRETRGAVSSTWKAGTMRASESSVGEWRAARSTDTNSISIKMQPPIISNHSVTNQRIKAGAPSVMHRVTSSLPWIVENLEGSGLCPRQAEPSPHCVTVAGLSLVVTYQFKPWLDSECQTKTNVVFRCRGWNAMHISFYGGWS